VLEEPGHVNGIHDLGGRHGFGEVVREPEECGFHAPWEGRVHALVAFVLSVGATTVDAFRHGIERLDPVTYLTVGYYGRWLRAIEGACIEAGVVSRDELAVRCRALAEGQTPEPVAPWRRRLQPPSPTYTRQVAAEPRFRRGDPVRARNLHPAGHTRLPGYVRGRRGLVLRSLGGFVFPDTNAHGLGEQPQHLYTVRFDADELWGPEADGPGAVHVDLFDAYLERA
jgi:nitrile hydratase